MENKKTRREFFAIIGFFGLGCGIAGYIYSALRFIVPNILYEPPTSFRIGKPEQYKINSPVFIRERHIFVFYDSQGMYSISSKCTHLGCGVNWIQGKKSFECPCHGSIFDKDGRVKKGPAPRPLESYAVELAADGNLIVNTSTRVDSDFRLKVYNVIFG
ncbi:MAG: ubiquinol-cytochrome c reductase iron-sulfur subunit [Candidatus Scalindua sp.]